MKTFYRIFYVFAIFTTIFFVLAASLTIALNTQWGKRKIITAVNDFSDERNINFSFDNLGGFLPFQFKLTNVELKIDENKSIQIEKLTFRPSYSKLLQKTLSFKTLTATNINTSGFDSLPTDDKFELFDKLVFAIQVKSFKLINLQIPKSHESLNINGKLKIGKNFSYISLNSDIGEAAFPNSHVNIRLRSSKMRFAKLDLEAEIDDSDSLKPYFDLPIQKSLKLKTSLSGSWDSLVKALSGRHDSQNDIKGTFNIFIERFDNDLTMIASDVEINGNVFLNLNGTVFLEQVSVFNDYLDAKGFLSLTSFTELQKADFSFNVYSAPNLKSIKLLSPIKGSIDLEKKENVYLLISESNIDTFTLHGSTISNTLLTLNAQIVNKKLQGTCTVQSDFQQRKLLFSSNIALNENFFSLTNAQLGNDFFTTNGNIRFYDQDKITGAFEIDILNISMLEAVFPQLLIDGSVKTKVKIDTVQNDQITISMCLKDIEYNQVGTSSGTLDLVISSPFKSPIFKINANLGPSRLYNTYFQTVMFNTDTEPENWPFEISTTGKNIDASANGFWHIDMQSLDINLQDFFGTIYNQSFFLNEPTGISWTKEKEFQISLFTISMEKAYLSASTSLAPNNASFEFEAENFPIDFITLNTLELSVQGEITGSMQFEYDKGDADGNFEFLTKNTRLFTPDDNEELIGSGNIIGSIKGNLLEIDANFQSNDKTLLNTFLSLGVKINPFPLQMSLLNHAPLNGKVEYNAKAEDLLDFFDLGFNFIRGNLECDLLLSGTLATPNITGDCVLANGTYENYLAGVYLKHINAKIVGKQNKLELIELTADGIKNGKLTATGELLLSYANNLPYVLNADLDAIQIVKLDYFEGKLQGNAILQGNTKQAILSGSATIVEADFSIPEKFTSPIPTLAVTYINVPDDFRLPEKKEKFDFYLDVNLNAPKNVFVRGRGLTAELKGGIKLEGAIDNIVTKGRLDLVKGDFLFSGHAFDLTKGEIVFGEEGALPFLLISAQTNIQGIAITASLSGQFDSPTLEFRSLPPLPLSSILSYLLFGSDISEISALQAVTLASTAASLAGSKTDILEATRRKLGVDRLAVISSPGSTGDEDFAVQIGKYVTKGVLISISQGVEQGSTNIIVEVDLKHGFVFSAESIQQEEQGRFFLKWNRNF